MKKILFAALLTGSTFLSSAQTQIPNGDFENWSAATHCKIEDSLDNFFTAASSLYLSTWKNLHAVNCPDAVSENKSTNAQSGNYALRLAPLLYDNNYYANGVQLGPMVITYYPRDAFAHIVAAGTPFTDRPAKLIGYCKFNQAAVSDVVTIELYSSTADDRLILNEELTISSSQSNYEKFELPLNYIFDEPTNPANLYIRILLKNSSNSTMNANSTVLVDNLFFEYATTTSTTNFSATSPINVYAANKNINFSENVSDIHVVDMVGAQKISEMTNTKTINTASLTAGMYIVTYKYNDAYFSKKVIIE